MPGFLGGNKAAAGGVPPGMNLKNALIQAAPLFASMAAGYSSGRGPYAYMDQGIASIQANQKAKRDEEAAAAAAAAFGNLRPGGMGAAGGTGGYGGGYKPPTDLPKANIGGISGMGQVGLSLPGVAPADMGMVGNGGLSFGGTSLPPEQAAIRAGLVARGYAPHVADGIMMNLADESAFNPAAVGDGGNALGLAQWNGPRKAALENFAASQGKSPTDIDVQLDFLDYELKGSHARAGEALMAAKTAPEAATVFLNQFEIPAEKHRVAREAAYLGGGTAPAAPAGPVDPMSDPYVQQLMAVMSMRGITPEQQAVLQVQLQSRIGMLTAPQPGVEEEAARAMRARDADLLGYTRGSPEWNQYVVTGEMPEPPKAGYTRLTPEQVATIPGLDATKAWQVSPEGKIEPIGGAGTNVTFDMGGGPELGKLSTDYGYVLGPDGKPKIDPATGLPMAAPVPGSPAALEAEAAANKSSLAADKTASTADVVLKKLDELDALVAGSGMFNPATGFGAETAANIGGTRAADTKAVIDTITGNLSFDNLAAMRAASPTGGALGAISDREIILLSSTLASLSQKQSPEQLAQNIKQLREIYTTIKAKAEAYPSAGQYGFGGAAPAGNTTSSGVTWSVAP